MPGAFGWTCPACGFEHQFPGTRCSCCHQLKGATRQEMRDFVLGKTLPPKKGDDDIVEVPPPTRGRTSAADEDDDDHDDDVVEVLEHPPAKVPRATPPPPAYPSGHPAYENEKQPSAILAIADEATIPTAASKLSRNPYAKSSASTPLTAAAARASTTNRPTLAAPPVAPSTKSTTHTQVPPPHEPFILRPRPDRRRYRHSAVLRHVGPLSHSQHPN
jgi:hypothetical protein